MRFPPSFLDEIRTRLPISTVVGRRVAWDKRKSQPGKGDFWACCPFHGEKTPSFHADDRRGRYHCFGCGASGDHFTFLVEREGLSFPEAVEQLAAEAGLALPERDADAERREAARASLYDVMEAAARFFEAALAGPDGGKARAYLRERGLTPDIQKRFRLGYAPASRSALKEHLAGKGIGQEQMIEAGLLIAGEDIAVSFDRFRDRIIFPITDLRGRVIAFGGRALSPDAQAKYLNSPDTPLFQKGQVLFNGQAARAALRQGKHLVVVEGYMDAIACVAAGFEATVAPLGTALTEEQLAQLWRIADEPILCFDGDKAGSRAADRVMDLARPLKSGKSLKFAILPEGRDPDDLIRAEGPEAFQRVLESAEPFSKMLLIRELEGRDLSIPEQRAALEERLYQIAASIGDNTLSRHYRDYFRLRMSELFWKSDGEKSAEHSIRRYRLRPPDFIERVIIGLCVEQPWLYTENTESLAEIHLKSGEYERFMKKLGLLLIENPFASVHEVYRKLGPEFYKVLDEVHGLPRGTVMDMQGNFVGIPDGAVGGHRLRAIFPGIKLQPSEEILDRTLKYFMMLHKLKEYEAETLEKLADEEEAERSLRGLAEFRRMVAEQERELDRDYQRLRFRAANDNSGGVGAAILAESPRNWREAIGR